MSKAGKRGLREDQVVQKTSSEKKARTEDTKCEQCGRKAIVTAACTTCSKATCRYCGQSCVGCDVMVHGKCALSWQRCDRCVFAADCGADPAEAPAADLYFCPGCTNTQLQLVAVPIPEAEDDNITEDEYHCGFCVLRAATAVDESH